VKFISGATSLDPYVIVTSFMERLGAANGAEDDINAALHTLLSQSFSWKDYYVQALEGDNASQQTMTMSEPLSENGKRKRDSVDADDEANQAVDDNDTSKPHARFHRRNYPLMMELRVLLHLDRITDAIIHAAKMETYSFLSFDEKQEAFRIIFLYLLQQNLLLRHPSAPPSLALELIFVPYAKPLAILTFLESLHDLSVEVERSGNVGPEVKGYMKKACHQAQVRLLFSRYTVADNIKPALLNTNLVSFPPLEGAALDQWLKSFPQESNPLPASWKTGEDSTDVTELLERLAPPDETAQDVSVEEEDEREIAAAAAAVSEQNVPAANEPGEVQGQGGQPVEQDQEVVDLYEDAEDDNGDEDDTAPLAFDSPKTHGAGEGKQPYQLSSGQCYDAFREQKEGDGAAEEYPGYSDEEEEYRDASFGKEETKSDGDDAMSSDNYGDEGEHPTGDRDHEHEHSGTNADDAIDIDDDDDSEMASEDESEQEISDGEGGPEEVAPVDEHADSPEGEADADTTFPDPASPALSGRGPNVMLQDAISTEFGVDADTTTAARFEGEDEEDGYEGGVSQDNATEDEDQRPYRDSRKESFVGSGGQQQGEETASVARLPDVDETEEDGYEGEVSQDNVSEDEVHRPSRDNRKESFVGSGGQQQGEGAIAVAHNKVNEEAEDGYEGEVSQDNISEDEDNRASRGDRMESYVGSGEQEQGGGAIAVAHHKDHEEAEDGYEGEVSQDNVSEDEDNRPSHQSASHQRASSEDVAHEIPQAPIKAVAQEGDPGYDADADGKPKKLPKPQVEHKTVSAETGYSAGESEELSEAAHTEDEEERRQSAEASQSGFAVAGTERGASPVRPPRPPADTNSDMSAADERTAGHDEELAQSSETEEIQLPEGTGESDVQPFYPKDGAGFRGRSLTELAKAAYQGASGSGSNPMVAPERRRPVRSDGLVSAAAASSPIASTTDPAKSTQDAALSLSAAAADETKSQVESQQEHQALDVEEDGATIVDHVPAVDAVEPPQESTASIAGSQQDMSLESETSGMKAEDRDAGTDGASAEDAKPPAEMAVSGVESQQEPRDEIADNSGQEGIQQVEDTGAAKAPGSADQESESRQTESLGSPPRSQTGRQLDLSVAESPAMSSIVSSRNSSPTASISNTGQNILRAIPEEQAVAMGAEDAGGSKIDAQKPNNSKLPANVTSKEKDDASASASEPTQLTKKDDAAPSASSQRTLRSGRSTRSKTADKEENEAHENDDELEDGESKKEETSKKDADDSEDAQVAGPLKSASRSAKKKSDGFSGRKEGPPERMLRLSDIYAVDRETLIAELEARGQPYKNETMPVLKAAMKTHEATVDAKYFEPLTGGGKALLERITSRQATQGEDDAESITSKRSSSRSSRRQQAAAQEAEKVGSGSGDEKEQQTQRTTRGRASASPARRPTRRARAGNDSDEDLSVASNSRNTRTPNRRKTASMAADNDGSTQRRQTRSTSKASPARRTPARVAKGSNTDADASVASSTRSHSKTATPKKAATRKRLATPKKMGDDDESTETASARASSRLVAKNKKKPPLLPPSSSRKK